MVIVLAVFPKFRGFKHGRGQWILSAIQIRSTPSFGGEVNPSATCRNILQHVKDPLRYDEDTDRQNASAIFRSVSPALLLGVSAATRAEKSGE
jgi:hypothetical protein